MGHQQGAFSVALVFPPYGPPELANLGLAALSAGIKARGIACRTFYWNYRFAAGLPYATAEERRRVYALLTQRDLFPWTEWAFTRWVFPDALKHRDPEVMRRIAALDDMVASTAPLTPSQLLLFICNRAAAIVAEMADELTPFTVIGIGTTFFQNGPALALAKHIKERWPKKIVVLGGANCDGEMGRGLIEAMPFLDYVFSGEVDHSFPDFVARLARGEAPLDVPGLIFRRGDGAVDQAAAARPVDNMNALPIPDFDDYIAERKRFGREIEDDLCLPLESSRGCWWGAKHHCTFCGLNANGMGYRQKDPERFKDEVVSIVSRYGARYLFMADNILSTKYFKDFVVWAKRGDLKIDFFYEIKANVDREQVADLAEAGISMVQPGIESFSTKTLRLMQKGVRGIQNVAFLKYAADNGVIVIYNILAGFPGEDPFEYERIAGEIPKLVHLSPPSGVIDIEIHRFSPFHNHPETFGISLAPHVNYSFIYPFDKTTLARIAYRFEIEGRMPSDLSYLRTITRAVRGWSSVYRQGAASLTWEKDGPDILIRDRRPSFGPCDYRLSNHAVAAFEALDSPTSLDVAVTRAGEHAMQSARSTGASRRGPSQAGREIEIGFTREQFAAEPARCLKDLSAAGLIYSEDNLHVTLPVWAGHRAAEAGWRRLAL